MKVYFMAGCISLSNCTANRPAVDPGRHKTSLNIAN